MEQFNKAGCIMQVTDTLLGMEEEVYVCGGGHLPVPTFLITCKRCTCAMRIVTEKTWHWNISLSSVVKTKIGVLVQCYLLS